jgi:hypothetical protein
MRSHWLTAYCGSPAWFGHRFSDLAKTRPGTYNNAYGIHLPSARFPAVEAGRNGQLVAFRSGAGRRCTGAAPAMMRRHTAR